MKVTCNVHQGKNVSFLFLFVCIFCVKDDFIDTMLIRSLSIMNYLKWPCNVILTAAVLMSFLSGNGM